MAFSICTIVYSAIYVIITKVICVQALSFRADIYSAKLTIITTRITLTVWLSGALGGVVNTCWSVAEFRLASSKRAVGLKITQPINCAETGVTIGFDITSCINATEMATVRVTA